MTDYEDSLKHRYRVRHGGDIVPGVTTIIDVIDKPALKWSAAGLAATAAVTNTRRKKTLVAQHRVKLSQARGKGDSVRDKHELAEHGSDDEVYAHWARGQFDVQWKAKAATGTRVHDIAERLTNGESVVVSDEDAGFVSAWERFYDEHQPAFHFVEEIVGNEDGPYGGRFDFIAHLRGSDRGLFLCDYKTGGHYPEPVALQAVGYKRAKRVTFDEAGNISGLVALPKLDGCRTVYLRNDGTYALRDPFELVDEDVAWRAFSSCVSLYATLSDLRKGLE